MAKFFSINIILPLLKAKNREEIEFCKKEISKKYGIPLLSNSQILKMYYFFLSKKKIKKNRLIEVLLRKRPVRSLSGVVNISVLTKPYPCPGRCIFCPKEKGLPKSYVSLEPAVERAKKLHFSPYLQVKKRIKNLQACGHKTEKIELRIIGGTFSFYPRSYQKTFIKGLFDGANNKKSKNLLLSQRENERTKNKIVSLSVETRPDFINENEIRNFRNLGITKVEIGVQTIFNDVLKTIQRGHSVQETIEATKLLKDAGFKISYQVMPNLPGSDLERDFLMFFHLFENEQFKPDYLKIYPLMILENTPIFPLFKKGKIKIYTENELKELIKKIKSITPYWLRIERIVRDIPHPQFKISNLRQTILQEMKKEKKKCHCIRCREVKDQYSYREKVYLFREDYFASGGKEIFLSFETKNREKLLSFLRLRIPSFYFKNEKPIFSILKESAIIRELKTLGELTGLHQERINAQHRGLGKKLIDKAQEICKKEFKIKKIAVIAGIGARNYFRNLNFKLSQTYMIKKI